jgi:hypothetical protein
LVDVVDVIDVDVVVDVIDVDVVVDVIDVDVVVDVVVVVVVHCLFFGCSVQIVKACFVGGVGRSIVRG